jgi:hypothetical protein
MDKQKRAMGVLFTAIVALSVMALALPAGAQDKTASAVSPTSIGIDNGIISITFGETGSSGWLFGGEYFCFREEPYISYGTNNPVSLGSGTVLQYYPAGGSTETWYDAIIRLDLDGDGVDDVNVTRSVTVPEGEKYFEVRYCIEVINDVYLDNLTLFQGVDYDIGPNIGTNNGGYDAGGAVYVEDREDLRMVAGFFGNRNSSHHCVDSWGSMWSDIYSGSLDDEDYYKGDVGVALQWDLGDLDYGETMCLEVTFFFDYLPAVEAPAVTPTGLIALVSALSAIAAVAIVRKRH